MDVCRKWRSSSVGMADYVVKENDAVILYYVDDYMDTKIPAMDAETENKQLAAEVTEKSLQLARLQRIAKQQLRKQEQLMTA